VSCYDIVADCCSAIDCCIGVGGSHQVRCQAAAGVVDANLLRMEAADDSIDHHVRHNPAAAMPYQLVSWSNAGSIEHAASNSINNNNTTTTRGAKRKSSEKSAKIEKRISPPLH
jgi:hypothetical protein